MPELHDASVVDGKQGTLRQRIDELAPWFHNLRIQGMQTAPHHFLGDHPLTKWKGVADAVPQDLSGLSVLDIGCNAGFYSHQMVERGASRVLGLDTDERYLEQARFAAEANGYKIEFRKMSVYELDQLHERFDIVLFLGVFYHLRYPLFALDKVVKKVRGNLLFQTMIRPFPDAIKEITREPEYLFWEQEAFRKPEFPRMHFIERAFAEDATNWWIPNVAAVEAILRSAGLKLLARPEEETWWCAIETATRNGRSLQEAELAGELWA